MAQFLPQTAFEILDGARTALRNDELGDTVAIHETRKAIKRWRALLRLMTFALGDESKRLRREARDLAHALGRSRDAQSALDALDDVLAHCPPGALPESAPGAMRERLLARRTKAEAAHLDADERERLATVLDANAEAIETWPLTHARFCDLTDALCKTYRRGRRRVPDDWQTADPDQFHELRQRTVELRYQLECVAPLLPGMPPRMISDAQRLRGQLGRRQDLTLLWPLMAPRQPLARWQTRLVPLIEARQAHHVATAERIAARVFADPPKTFRKQLVGFRKAL